MLVAHSKPVRPLPPFLEIRKEFRKEIHQKRKLKTKKWRMEWEAILRGTEVTNTGGPFNVT